MKKKTIATTNNKKDRINALAAFLDITPEEIQPETYRDNLFTTPDGEYLVLTDNEATSAAVNEIANSLWAFRAEFIFKTCDLTFTNDAVKSLESMQCKCCESCNEFIRAIIDGTCGFEYFAEGAILADGRGHFIAQYDSEENEQGKYFIYRVN